MNGIQVNLRFNEDQIGKLKEVASRHGVASDGKREPHVRLIREAIQALFLSSSSEREKFLGKYSLVHVQNRPQIQPQALTDDWCEVVSTLSAVGISPEQVMGDWVPLIRSIFEIGLDITVDTDDLLRRASKLAAIQTVVNAVSARSENVRQQAAEDVLDRSGFKPVERSISINQFDALDEAELNALLLSYVERREERLAKTSES